MMIKSSPVFVSRLETGRQDCAQAFQRRIAAALHCTPSDLLGQPDEARLAQIRADYLRHQADQAAAEAEAAKRRHQSAFRALLSSQTEVI